MIWVLLVLLMSNAVQDASACDARFDKTGDRVVDASDWEQMTQGERTAYARTCVESLNMDPDAGLADGSTRVQRYLEGLKMVYGREKPHE